MYCRLIARPSGFTVHGVILDISIEKYCGRLEKVRPERLDSYVDPLRSLIFVRRGHEFGPTFSKFTRSESLPKRSRTGLQGKRIPNLAIRRNM